MKIDWVRAGLRAAAGFLLTAMSLCAAQAASSASPTPAAPPQVVIEQRTVTLPTGEVIHYEIGTLSVPENRRKPTSRTIGVGFARIKAPQPTGAPPVFWLPGGPGLSVLGSFTDGTAGATNRLSHWLGFGQVGDLVIVEQRGYTQRGEMLTEMSDALPLENPASVASDVAAMKALARRAVAHNSDKDLSGYTIDAFAADVDDIRRALGYEKISLFGGSFGSQWSLAVMRFYPDSVARAVLSAVEPLNHAFDMPSHVFGAMQRIVFDADRDAGLAPYLPKGGLMAAIQALHQRFAAGPVRVSIRDVEGQVHTVALGAEDLQRALLSHTEEAARWPAFILSLYHGHYEQWATETMEDRRAAPMILIGPLADSSLSASVERRQLMETDPVLGLLGSWNFEANFASAADWPTADIGDEVRLARVSDIPVIFVHGDWDTATPMENTLELLPYFPKGRALLVHRGGHDGTFYQLRQDSAAKQAIYDFLRTGEMAGLPATTSLAVPQFEVPEFAPEPSPTP